ncbi:hypothetical protein ACLMJK_004924 [Lecanora helva]
MFPFLHHISLPLLFIFISTALALTVPQPANSLQPALSDFNQTLSLVTSLNITSPSEKPTGAWRCTRGGFSITKRAHYSHCEAAIAQLPNTQAQFPVVKTYKTCAVTVTIPESKPPTYWSWGEIKREGVDLVRACKEQMSWTFWLGGQTTWITDFPIRIEVAYNAYRASRGDGGVVTEGR